MGFRHEARALSLIHMTKDAARLVLVVEDDVSVRRPLVKFLEMHGFSVVTAETADEGLEALKKNRLVAAVVDLRLRKRARAATSSWRRPPTCR